MHRAAPESKLGVADVRKVSFPGTAAHVRVPTGCGAFTPRGGSGRTHALLRAPHPAPRACRASPRPRPSSPRLLLPALPTQAAPQRAGSRGCDPRRPAHVVRVTLTRRPPSSHGARTLELAGPLTVPWALFLPALPVWCHLSSWWSCGGSRGRWGCPSDGGSGGGGVKQLWNYRILTEVVPGPLCPLTQLSAPYTGETETHCPS